MWKFIKKSWLTLLPLGMVLIAAVYLLFPYATAVVAEKHAPQTETLPLVATERTQPMGIPVRLSIARLNFEVPIQIGEYNTQDKTWTLDSRHAFFMPAGQTPLTADAWPLLYGHHRSSVFSPLSRVKAGDILQLDTENGHTFYFEYFHDQVVEPDQGVILNDPPEGTGVQLLTCEGPLFDKRRILYFGFIGEAKEPGITI